VSGASGTHKRPTAYALIAGLDGCRGGWIAAIEKSGATRLQILASLNELFEDPALLAAVIDVPIGLPEAGPRSCDLMARQLLRAPRASSVFPAPIRPMLPARDQGEASRLRFAAEGKRCSVQLAAILPKIREVDNLLNPGMQLKVREGHPEVSFAIMNGGKSMSHAKRRLAGRKERIGLLRDHFPEVLTALSEVGRLRLDAIDAYAMLWTARRLVEGSSRSLPDAPTIDRRGLRMEIVA
jgi:predicted RNase H-like nuclease